MSCVTSLSLYFLDLDMNDIHQTIEWVSKKSRPTSNPDFDNSASDHIICIQSISD